jgi:putative hydrolase of the HAD superfamily
MTVRAVVFDYYFTLADGELHALPPIDDLLRRYDAEVDAAEVLRAWRGFGVPDVERALDGERPAFQTLYARWTTHGDRLLRQFGITGCAEEWADCRREAHRRATAYPDVSDALAELRRSGLALGVLSDADTDTLLPSIERNGLELDAVLCSEDHGCYKPHRSLFVAACAALEVEPADAIYVGDNPTADVVGARNAGMRAVWINRQQRRWPDDLDPPDRAIRSLVELPSYVASIA